MSTSQPNNSTKQPDLQERLSRFNSLLFDARSYAFTIEKQIHHINSDPLLKNQCNNADKKSPNGFLEELDDKLNFLAEVVEILRSNSEKLTSLTGITTE